jgi:hypothetical protein
MKDILVRWAFSTGGHSVTDDELSAAKLLLQQDPKNMTANVTVALGHLDRGMMVSAKIPSMTCKTEWSKMNIKNSTLADVILTDGVNEISMSSFHLFVSVIYGALTSFNDFTVSELLTYTQESLKRGADAATVM